MKNKNKINIYITKGFRVFFSIGIALVAIMAIINDEEIYVPIILLLVGSLMLWFIGKHINEMEKEMTHKRTDFSFSLKTLIYLLFSKKKCLNCDSKKMKKLVKKDYIGKGKNIRIKHFGDKPDLYSGKIYYECSNCGEVFTLETLASSKREGICNEI